MALRALLLLALSVIAAAVAEDVQLVSRAEWGAQPAGADITEMKLPLLRVVIAHTAGATCTDDAGCAQQMRSLQNYQQKTRHFADIGYHYLIGNNGRAYEGRSLTQQGAFAQGANAGSLGIAFMGNYNQKLPTAEALAVAQALIAQALEQQQLTADYKLLGHRQLTPSNSPGDRLYEAIKQWPHWTETV